MNASTNPPIFEDHTSPLSFSNDGNLQVVKQSNPPKSFVVADDRDQHVELFTMQRKVADAFIAGYDYSERLHREGVEHQANVQRIKLIITSTETMRRSGEKASTLRERDAFVQGLRRSLAVLDGKG